VHRIQGPARILNTHPEGPAPFRNCVTAGRGTSGLRVARLLVVASTADDDDTANADRGSAEQLPATNPKGPLIGHVQLLL
jgi:hypothetical protein